MLYFNLKEGSAGVMVTGFKKGMGVAALPGTATPEVLLKLGEP